MRGPRRRGRSSAGGLDHFEHETGQQRCGRATWPAASGARRRRWSASALAGAMGWREVGASEEARYETRVAQPIASRNDIRVTWRGCETSRLRSLCHGLHPRGPGARPLHWRHHHPDLPDLDLRAGGPRPAQGLRVRPHPESHAHGARGQRGGDRARHRRLRLRLGHGRHRHRADPPAVGRPRGRERQHLRRHLPPVRARAPQVRARLHLRRHLRPRRHRPGLHRADQVPVRGIADQPDARRSPTWPR